MRIDAEDLRALHSAEAGSELVVYEGKVAVRATADLQAGEYPGALTVVSRDDLLDEMSRHNLTENDFDSIAGRLNTAMTNRGG
ncbi:hypothetical protein DFQ14_103128 [Halopolyspora algeriensis]|uniref:Uncharacterized protein n=1 Tax=Halopolyspora algeriensis TaxID=1500506 RepID=A0A368VZT0_9ACTN|nr:hypothetical protein [Halopolyspora algeriensis]RCW45164.1 hypothetical protein DFQ14_103128 [Halopolyspora algeriensis]TQM53117.1 hypothetical protein FHU43_2496 [Halopolyspora algeriensis]